MDGTRTSMETNLLNSTQPACPQETQLRNRNKNKNCQARVTKSRTACACYQLDSVHDYNCKVCPLGARAARSTCLPASCSIT
eukprot:6474417-Amphidinium_carterae.2